MSKSKTDGPIVIARDDYPAQIALVCGTDEAAELLGTSRARVKQFCSDGRLAAARIGRDLIISRESVKALAAVPRPNGVALSQKPNVEPARPQKGIKPGRSRRR